MKLNNLNEAGAASFYEPLPAPPGVLYNYQRSSLVSRNTWDPKIYTAAYIALLENEPLAGSFFRVGAVRGLLTSASSELINLYKRLEYCSGNHDRKAWNIYLACGSEPELAGRPCPDACPSGLIYSSSSGLLLKSNNNCKAMASPVELDCHGYGNKEIGNYTWVVETIHKNDLIEYMSNMSDNDQIFISYAYEATPSNYDVNSPAIKAIVIQYSAGGVRLPYDYLLNQLS